MFKREKTQMPATHTYTVTMFVCLHQRYNSFPPTNDKINISLLNITSLFLSTLLRVTKDHKYFICHIQVFFMYFIILEWTCLEHIWFIQMYDLICIFVDT